MRSAKYVVVLSFVVWMLAGCKPDAALKHAEVLDKGTQGPQQAPPPPPDTIAAPTVPIDQTALGNITGNVRVKGIAPSEQVIVNGDKLANVFVYVKNGPPAAMSMGTSMAPPVVIDQRGGLYVPHVVGVMVGGYVEFRNSDAVMYNIHTMPAAVGNATVDVSQGPHGPPVDRQFLDPELMIPVHSNNHPGMSAYINVSATPFFAVTDKTGHYDLIGLPAGTYTIAAVHEKLGEQTLQVTVSPRSWSNGDLTFGK